MHLWTTVGFNQTVGLKLRLEHTTLKEELPATRETLIKVG